MPSTRTAMYRLFDAHDNLLFISRSIHPEDRVQIHRRCTAGWQVLIARHEVQWFANSTAALRAHRVEALADPGPLYPDPLLKPAPPAVPVYVYRLYDNTDQLLYVGQTKDPTHRLSEHALGMPIARYTLEEFTNRRTASAAEGHAIDTENPLYNERKGNHGPKAEPSGSKYVNPWPIAEAVRARYEAGEITIRAAFAEVMLLDVNARKACHLLGWDDGGWQLRSSHRSVEAMIKLNNLH